MENYRYTVISFNFDNYEIIREIKNPLPDVEYIYVTNDENAISNTWKIIVDTSYNKIENSFDKVVEFRKRVLDYCATDICCRIDGSIQISGDAFDKTVEEFNNGNYDIAFIMHPWFNTIDNEYKTWCNIRGIEKNEADKVLEFFHNNSYDTNLNSVYTLTMLIQRNNEICHLINEKQYETLCNIREYCGVWHFNRCDQAIFTYTMDKYFSNASVMPLHFSILERGKSSHIYIHGSDTDRLYNKVTGFKLEYVLFSKKITKVFNGNRWIHVLTNNEIYDNSSKVLLKLSLDAYTEKEQEYISKNIDSYKDWLSNENVVTIGSSNITDYQYNDANNRHHFTIDWYYNKLLPIIASQLNIPYNENDFVTIHKNEMYCKLPKQIQVCDVYCPDFYWNRKTGYVEVYYNLNCVHPETSMSMFMVTEQHKQSVFGIIDDDYHNMFKYTHLPVKIVNYSCDSERVLLLIGNSHTIPFVPILLNYFHKIILIDNRLSDFTHDALYTYENITDILILASYDINKNELLHVSCFD